MKSDAARNDGIVAPSDEVDQPPIWGLLFVPAQMLDTASTTQQRLHKARPIFLLDLGQRSEFAQVVRIAKRVFNARHREVKAVVQWSCTTMPLTPLSMSPRSAPIR